MSLKLSNTEFQSRLFLGTGKFSSTETMLKAVKNSGTEFVTMALKRVNWKQGAEDILVPLKNAGVKLLPNTSGARTAEEAILLAQLAREILDTQWIKLEIHPDQRYLMPDPIETLVAAEQLTAEGFTVLPYVHADPVLCKRLEEVGCAAVMPLAAPIGSNQGLKTKTFIDIIIQQSQVPVIVDAGLGSPSHAAEAMEMGADAVLVNTAIASAEDPEGMAMAFNLAVKSGRQAYQSGIGTSSPHAQATSPMDQFLETCQ